MRTDRELLELAAKAAGLEVWGGQWPQDDMLFVAPKSPDPSGKVTGVEWNPLTDDGDALRLAVKLGLAICDWRQYNRACVDDDSGREHWEPVGDDPWAATRRAIVRAAAAIGSEVTA